MPAGSTLFERYSGYRYLVEIDGIVRAAFRDCSGLSVYLNRAGAHVDYFIGDDALDLTDVAAEESGHHLTLEHGIGFDPALIEWHNAALSGAPERHAGAIVELDAQGHVQSRWSFRKVWPVAWGAFEQTVGLGPIAIERLELAHDGLVRG